MSEAVTLHLSNPVQARPLLTQAWELIRGFLLNGRRVVVEVREETRSDAQNRLLHSRIGDVAKHCTWAGRKWNTDEWKRLLTAAWCRTRNEGVEIVPAIDGKGFDVLYQRTSKLSRRDCADLSEYVMAWGTDQGVQWCAASSADADTGEVTA